MPTYLDLEIKYGAKQNNTKVFEKWAEVPRGRVPRPKPLCRYGWVLGVGAGLQTYYHLTYH